MKGNNKNRLSAIISLLLAVIMVVGNFQMVAFAAETITQGQWTITNDTASGEATFGTTGFTYHSPTTQITSGASGGKDYVRSSNTNGSASNGIVVTAGKSYCDFTPAKNGTLTVYVGNASTKQGYVSKTKTADGTSTAVGTFVPGGSDDYNNDEMKVTQGTTWATVDVEVEQGYTYYITLSGSKMFCYGMDYVAYTLVQGTINDSFNLGSYEIKLTNKTTGEAINATVSGKSYSALLKPNYQYSASLTGSNAINYSITSASRLIDVAVQDSQTADLTIEESISYTVSGDISGITSTLPDDTRLVFVPDDTAGHEEVTATIDAENKTYSAQLVAGENYTLKLVGAYDYKLSETVVVTNNDSTAVSKDIALTAVPTYSVGGKFIGLTQVRGQYEDLSVAPASLSFKNIEDDYTYSATVSAGSYTANLRDGSYIAVVTDDKYSSSTHVIVKGGAVTRNLLLKDNSPATVEYKATINVGKDKEYKSVQSAVDAVANMTRPSNEGVTILIDPAIYREQVVVNTPNITFESNGGDRNNTKISWYYGIGYKYYSCVDSYYNAYADYDRFEKGNVVKYWGSAVITNAGATGFKAKNIGFENSFNKYMTDAEITDGAEPNGLEAIKVERKETTNVDTRTATERAAALVNYADKTEFDSCAFIGSQDTLYTGNKSALQAYYKNCYIEGQTDYIYGTGDVVFDGCELNFCGYDGTEAAGYITANSCSSGDMAKAGYVFRGCFISYNKERDVTAGYWGRMWGNSAKVAFINTQLEQADMIVPAGWAAMSSVDPTSPSVTLKEYNTTFNGTKVDTAGRVNGVVDTIDSATYAVQSVFIDNGWTPVYYTAEATTAPEFAADPSMTSNGDLNAPNPGEKITLGYALGDEWKNDDASAISWYAVDEGYDGTSLDTILNSATLLGTSSAAASIVFQIPMACAGKYIMAVVTPITTSGLAGTPKYALDKEKLVSNTWSDPENPGSIAPGSGINIYLAGDSTVKDYSALGIYNGGKTMDQGSWGEFLQDFFNPDIVKVNNYAQGGRSSRSFINEGKLDTIISNIKAGDYLLVQFGHNDCANGKDYYEERFAPLFTPENPKTESGYPTVMPTESMKVDTPAALKATYGDKYYSWNCGATYKGYIQQYIDEALAKGAIPVIVSPVSRLYYNADGTIKAHHDATATDYEPTLDYRTTNDAYVTACEELYNENKEKGVLYIDAFNISKKLYEDAFVAGGNETNGNDIMAAGDKTHSNKTGGVIQAGELAKWLQDANISVSPYVAQPTTAYGENSNGKYIFSIKDKEFTANNNSFAKNDYWTTFGQALFDSIGGVVTPPSKTVELNFATDDSYAKYITNAADTFTDGVLTGKYTNAENQTLDASVYQSGIQYYSTQMKYGTKLTVGKPVFSFKADKAANYTITSTVATGSGTIGLYTDAACTTAVATAETGTSLVYKKTDDTPQTLYVGASVSSNLYVKEFTVSYVIPKTVTLDFNTAEAVKLYETDAASTYTEGVYTGTYTNAEGQSFDASVYKAGIGYYNSQAQYGTKATVQVPVFSFVAPEKGMYTMTVTAGTGSGTLNFYSDKECTTSLVGGSVPGTVVYKKTTDTPETIYVATSAANNFYLATAAIKKEALPADVKVHFTGNVSGLETDDTNVNITLKGSTETLNISATDYKANGIDLIVGETYAITAKGDKGVYLGTDIVTDNSGVADLVFSRISFDFPLDFMESYDDYKVYLDAKGYGSSDVTDDYSGITIHPNGIVMSDAYKQYGVKTNANSIMSFKAKQTGICTVAVDTSVSGSDKLILKVNGKYAPNLTNAVQGSVNSLSVMVNKDDEVTIYTPTRSNLWYKSINVSYSPLTFSLVNSVMNTADDELMVYGFIPTAKTADAESVGFVYTTTETGDLSTATVGDESTIAYDKVTYNGNDYTATNGKVFATVLSDISQAGTANVNVYIFCKSAGKTYYSAPTQIALS